MRQEWDVCLQNLQQLDSTVLRCLSTVVKRRGDASVINTTTFGPIFFRCVAAIKYEAVSPSPPEFFLYTFLVLIYIYLMFYCK